MSHHSRRRAPAFGPLLSLVALAALTVLGAPSHVLAQSVQSGAYFDRNNNVGVLDRPRPDYEALGIQLRRLRRLPVDYARAGVQWQHLRDYERPDRGPDHQDHADAGGEVQLVAKRDRPQGDGEREFLREPLIREHGRLPGFRQAAGSTSSTQSDVSAGFSAGHFAIPRTAQNTFGPTASPIQYDEADRRRRRRADVEPPAVHGRFRFAHTPIRTMPRRAAVPLALQPVGQRGLRPLRASGLCDHTCDRCVRLRGRKRPALRRHADHLAARPNSSGFEITVGTDFDITRLVRGQISGRLPGPALRLAPYHTVSGPSRPRQGRLLPVRPNHHLALHLDRRVVDAVDPMPSASCNRRWASRSTTSSAQPHLVGARRLRDRRLHRRAA